MRRIRPGSTDNALQKTGLQRADAGRNVLRVIGGKWRGRRIRFPGRPGIRPTPDRVRETLFNWLAPVVADSRCLDLFAGSGALGLEALSRGAADVAFVESDRVTADALRETVKALAPGRGLVILGDALRWLEGPPQAFDIVFLDPPFDSGLVASVFQRLDSSGWLAPQARIYLEMPAADGTPAMPPGWILHRSGKAGAVGYHLALRQGQAGVGPT
jgi:16S rRNA (guanine966-N2)-methyltransferase